MKAIRLSRSLIVVVALVVSLGANVALFVGGVVYSVVDEFVDQAVGLTTAAAAQRRALGASRAVAATQRREIGALKALSKKQRTENAALRASAVQQKKKLEALATTNKKKLAALGTTNRKLAGQLGKISNAVSPAAKRSRDRLVESVGRSILTAPGKALPYAGLAIVAALTTWEIKDLCATIRDMNEIQKASGTPEAEVESEPTDCARPDLAVERAFEKGGNYSREKWEELKKYIPDLPGWEDIPDSWRDAWRSIFPGTWDRMNRLLE